jgi:hypothetical protein
MHSEYCLAALETPEKLFVLRRLKPKIQTRVLPQILPSPEQSQIPDWFPPLTASFCLFHLIPPLRHPRLLYQQ